MNSQLFYRPGNWGPARIGFFCWLISTTYRPFLAKQQTRVTGNRIRTSRSHHSFIQQQLPKAWLTQAPWKYEDEDPNTENGVQSDKKDVCHAAGMCPEAEAKHRELWQQQRLHPAWSTGDGPVGPWEKVGVRREARQEGRRWGERRLPGEGTYPVGSDGTTERVPSTAGTLWAGCHTVTGAQARDTPRCHPRKANHSAPPPCQSCLWPVSGVRQQVLSAAATSLLRGLQRQPWPQGWDYNGNARSTRSKDRGCEALRRKAWPRSKEAHSQGAWWAAAACPRPHGQLADAPLRACELKAVQLLRRPEWTVMERILCSNTPHILPMTPYHSKQRSTHLS